MNKKEKSGFYIFISAIAINVTSSVIYTIIEKVNIIIAFKNVWKILIAFLRDILLIEFRLWLVLVFLVVLAIVAKIYFEIKKKPKVNNIRPDFMNYTTGVYKGIYYRWKIVKNYSNEFKIEQFRPICKCGAELTRKNSYKNTHYSDLKLFCVNCDQIIEEIFDYETKEDAKLYFSNELNKKINKYNESIQA